MRKYISILLVLLFYSNSYAAVGIQDINVGMPYLQIKPIVNSNTGRCSKFTCDQIVKIKGISTSVHYLFNKYDESPESVLEQIVIEFPSQLFEEMVSALTEKHGKPNTTENSKLSNRYGAILNNTTNRWLLSDGYIVANRHGEKASDGSIIMYSKEKMEKIKTENKKRLASPGF